MTHHFDCDIARKYGLNQAIVFNSIAYWVHYFEANNEHCFDGKYWVYNSKPAWQKLFPYLSERSISYALDKLKEQGLIETGHYNTNKYDRTLWYTLTEKGQAEYYKEPLPDSAISVNALTDNCNSMGTKMSDERVQNCPTYTNINTYINNNICSEHSSSQHNLLLKDGTTYNVPLEDIERYKVAYPDKEVEQELIRMQLWCESNPTKLKTLKGIKKFITNWLSRKDKLFEEKNVIPSTDSSPELDPHYYDDWKL